MEKVCEGRSEKKWIGLIKAIHLNTEEGRIVMTETIYKIVELVGTSTSSWEDAAKNAIETASKTLKDLRIAEITKLDLRIEDGKVVAYRARVNLSFKYEK
jgi:dodecin